MAKEIEEYEVSLGDLKVSFDDNVDSSKYVPIDRYEEDIKGITDKLADINVDLSGNEPSAVSISSNGVTYKIQNLKEGKAVSIDSANKVNVKYDTNKFYINENNELTYDISKLSVNADNDTLFFDEKDENKLKAALSLEYDNTNHKINLLSKNGIVSAIDAGDFIKDGMLSNVSVSGNILIMSFNTDSGIEDIEVDLSVLQKIYKGDNTTINVSDKGVISLNTSLLDKINGYESQITSLSSDIDSLRTEYQTADNNIYTAIEEAEKSLNDTIDEKIAGVGDDKITKVTNLLEYESKENEIVQYIGESNSFYKNGYFYRKNEDGSWSSVDVQEGYTAGDNINISNRVISLDNSITTSISKNTSDIEELESTCTAHGTAIQEITSDIEEIEDRIGNLDYVPQISDLSNYNCEVGTIVQYIGETNENYVNGYFYKNTSSGEGSTIIINQGDSYYEIVNPNNGHVLIGSETIFSNCETMKFSAKSANKTYEVIVPTFINKEDKDKLSNMFVKCTDSSGNITYERIDSAIVNSIGYVNGVYLNDGTELSSYSRTGGKGDVVKLVDTTTFETYYLGNGGVIISKEFISCGEDDLHLTGTFIIPNEQLGTFFGQSIKAKTATEKIIVSPQPSWGRIDVQPADDISPLENRVSNAEKDIKELQNRSTAEWGNITGDIMDQEDLNNALNTKLDGTNGEGVNSSQLGLGTIAKGAYQVVLGRYNVIDNENRYALIVGNGTSETDRSNAYTVDWNGNIQFNDISYIKNLGNVSGVQQIEDASLATENNVLYIVTG